MKKPLIVIVDDEPAVLEALEAALTQAFSDICRIEAYTDPRDVLDMTTRWAEEERALALAIVDQKMPHLTGVELLTRLRASDVANTSCQAIILTGYAGLDSALAAKNQADVARYLQKPWDAEELLATVRTLLRRYLDESGLSSHHVFREVVEEDDVRAHLALRFAVYRYTQEIKDVLPQDDLGLDVDAYDAVSRLFNLTKRTLVDETVIGTMRVTSQGPGPGCETIRSILNGKPSLLARYSKERPFPLPMMSYLVDREAVESVFHRITERGEQVVEAGRLALLPEHRARHLATHMIESAISFFFFFGIEHALITMVAAHAPIYYRYGFRETEGTTTKYQPALKTDVTCLHGTLHGVPKGRRERLSTMAARIDGFHYLCRCATFPRCLPEPYSTGRFHSTDLFCPALARRLLTE